jgi:hypothetical protein
VIQRITKQRYNQLKSIQKLSFALTGTIFEGKDGKYYECDRRGAESLREIWNFQKELRDRLTAQTNLLE